MMTSTPSSVRIRAVGVGDLASVMSASTLEIGGEADEVLAADLRGVGDHDHEVGARTMARLTAASSLSGVDSPCRALIPLVPMNATSTRRLSSTRSACSPTAAWVMPRTRPPSSCSDTVGTAASRAAMGTELVTTRARGRSAAGRRCGGGGAGVQQHARAAQGEELGRGRGDGVLVVGAGGLPLADARFDEVQGARGHGAAVHPAQHAGLVEHGEVAAHGLGGDVVGLSQFGHRRAALADHHGSDRVLALFGVHDSPVVWVIALKC